MAVMASRVISGYPHPYGLEMRRQPHRCIYIVLLLLMLLSLFVEKGLGYEDGAGDAAHFLRSGIGARARGMGGAFTAIADDDVSSPYWNPAGLIQSASVCVGGTYESRYGGLAEFQCIAGTFFSSILGAGFIWAHLDMYSVYSVSAAVGLRELALGVTGKLYDFSVPGQRASGVGIDVGSLYRTSLEGVEIALAVMSADIGWSEIRWQGKSSVSRDHAAWVTHLGAGTRLQTRFGPWRVAADLEIALRRPPRQGESDYFSTALQSSLDLGGEVWLGKIAFRAGLADISITDGELSARATLGLGIRVEGIAFDVAWVPSQLGSTYILSTEVRL